MPESKKTTKKPKTTSANVDWAERLKASMNQTLGERTASAPMAEEDDLAALLRAQLAKREEPLPTVNQPDLEGFEQEEPAVHTEEPTVETASPDPVGMPDSVKENAGEPTDEAAFHEPAEAFVPAEANIEEPTVAVKSDAPVESLAPTEADNAVSAGNRAEVPCPEELLSMPTDGEEDLLSPDGVIGDPRLVAAERESARLLEELYPEEPAREEDELPPAGDGLAEEPFSQPSEPSDRGDAAMPPSIDPLQLGLDDILPHGETVGLLREEASDGSASGSYTASMIRTPRESAVQDTELYLSLGYEEQIARTDRHAVLEEARRRARERAEQSSRNETATVKSRREYTDRSQTPGIEGSYSRAKRGGMARLCVAAVGALFGLLYDLLGVLNLLPGLFVDPTAPLYPLLSVLWTLFVCIPFLSRLGRGLKSLMDFEPTRYAVSAVALLAAVAYGILGIFIPMPCLYGGVALLMLTVAAASEYMTVIAESLAFSVVSAGKAVYTLTDELTPASAANAEAAPKERTLTAVRAGRLADYFARTGRYNPYMGRLNYLLPVALLAAILCAGLALLRGGSIMAHALPVFMGTYLLCLPAAYLVAMCLPLLRANGLLGRKGAAVIGAAAPADTVQKGSTRILIPDGDALGGLNRKEITLRDDPHISLWRHKANCLFLLLESTLSREPVSGQEGSEGFAVEVTETEEGYARLYLVDLRGGDTTEIMMGSRDALSRRGIRLPKASMERVYKKTEDSQVIYLAFDRTFRIAYSVEYRVGRTFARAVSGLASMGDTAAVVTYDPMVSAALLEAEGLESAAGARLLRPSYAEPFCRFRSGNTVATGRSLDLLYPYAACRRMRRVYRLAHWLAWLSLPFSVGIAVLAVLTGQDILLSSAVVSAWQLLWTGLLTLVSLSSVTRKALFLPSDRMAKRPSEPIPEATPSQTNTDKDQTSS